MHIAIENENIEIIKLILLYSKLNINLNSQYKTVYYYEEPQNKEQEMVAQLGSKESEKTTLFTAIEKGNIDIIQLLLSYPEIDINMHSILTESWIWKDPKKLDDDEVYVFKVNKKKSPLHYSIEMKNTQIIRLLLKQKSIDVDVVDENGKKPIDCTDDKRIKKLFNKFNK